MVGMGGGMGGGIGSGMGSGIGGGMGGMGGMMTPEARNRRLQLAIAASAAQQAASETNPKSRATLKKLEEPIPMAFANETPLEDVLKYIKQATTTPTYRGIPIYVDPKGLNEAEVTLQSPVIMDLDGIPLRTSLRLILKQLGLAYCIRDGVLIISSVADIHEELQEEQHEQEAKDGQGAGGSGAADRRGLQ
jgi:hypothetical protein